MSRTLYPLLVGINVYPPPVRSLHGCVNDVHRLEQLLCERVKTQGDTLHLLDQGSIP